MPKKSTKSKSNPKKKAWFYSVRGSYLPRSWQAWFSYVPYLAVLVGSEMWAHQPGASLIDQIFKIFPIWIAAAVVMTWLAKKMS